MDNEQQHKDTYILQHIYSRCIDGIKETDVVGVYSTLEDAQKEMRTVFSKYIDAFREVGEYKDKEYLWEGMYDEDIAHEFFREFSYDKMGFRLADFYCCNEYHIVKVDSKRS